MKFKNEMDKGVAGAIANTENSNIISRTVEDAAGIAFGKPVAQGVNDKGVRATKADDSQFVGITVLDRTATDLINGKFVQYESARVLDRGVIWVTVSEAVTAGDPVAITVATGAFAKTVATTVTVAMANAVYDTSAASGGLAQLRLK